MTPENEQAASDNLSVDIFACIMKDKLAKSRAKGRAGWEQCDPTALSAMLREHVEKGDPVDVANFCMFLWHLQQPIAPHPITPPFAAEEIDAVFRRNLDLRIQNLTVNDKNEITWLSISCRGVEQSLYPRKTSCS